VAYPVIFKFNVPLRMAKEHWICITGQVHQGVLFFDKFRINDIIYVL